jgi:hypothetical protein
MFARGKVFQTGQLICQFGWLVDQDGQVLGADPDILALIT